MLGEVIRNARVVSATSGADAAVTATAVAPTTQSLVATGIIVSFSGTAPTAGAKRVAVSVGGAEVWGIDWDFNVLGPLVLPLPGVHGGKPDEDITLDVAAGGTDSISEAILFYIIG